MAVIDASLLRSLCERAQCARWGVTPQRFEMALARSLEKGLPGESSSSAAEKYLRGLHLEDLALACACEDGHDAAWEHFVREFRPALYRAATAIDSTGGARDLADGLYGELFGLKEKEGVRQSLFRYFHGRSSLGTWLRSVLSQRHVDRVRVDRRTEPLPEDEGPAADSDPGPTTSPDARRHVAVVALALAAAIGALAVRDRLRLACYYAQNLTLAQIGKLTGEHEATVSRHLTRTRREVKQAVEERLRQEHDMGAAEIAESLATAAADVGDLDLATLLDSAPRKDPPADRSKKGKV